MYKDKALQRKTTLARVRRYRALHKEGVTELKTIEAPAIPVRVMKALNPTVEGIKQFGGIEVKNKQEEVRATKRLLSQPFQSFFKSNQLKQRSTA